MADEMTTPTPKRRFRFSLRTLFVFFTLVAVLLGVWGYSSLAEMRAIRAVREAGGSVYFTKGRVRSIQFQDRQFNDDAPIRLVRRFADLESLSFGNCTFAEGSFAPLSGMASLVRLEVHQSNITDDDLRSIAELPNLQLLSISNSPHISDAGLAHLGALTRLQVLSLWEPSNISGEGLSTLGGLKSLRTLVLRGSRVTDKSLAGLEALSELETLSLADTNVGDEALRHVGKLKRLSTLTLNNSRVTDAGLVYLEEVPSLVIVQALGTAVTKEGADRLQTALRAQRPPPLGPTIHVVPSVQFQFSPPGGPLGTRGP